MGIAKLGLITTIKSKLQPKGQSASQRTALPNCSENRWDALFKQYQTTGNNRALETLYDEFANRLYYYLLIMSDPNTAADITQKTWLKIVEAPTLYNPQGQFQAWLFTVGHRLLIDDVRRNQQWVYDNDMTLLPDTDGPNSSSDDFHQALKQLPFIQREALSLQQEGFSLQDIATICNVPVETVKTRLRYARSNLRKLWTTAI